MFYVFVLVFLSLRFDKNSRVEKRGIFRKCGENCKVMRH